MLYESIYGEKKEKKRTIKKFHDTYATSRAILVKLFEFIETERKLDRADDSLWTRIQSFYEMCHRFQIDFIVYRFLEIIFFNQL